MSLQERVRRKQEYLDSRQRQLNSKQSESRFQHKARKVETVETSQQRADQLEVL